MAERIPSPRALTEQLTQIAYNMDADFRRGRSDATEFIKTSKISAGEYIDDAGTLVRLYDHKSIFFAATRDYHEPSSKTMTPPHHFVARLDVQTQLDALPLSIRHYLPDNETALYSEPNLGDLTLVQSVEYTIDDDGDEIDMVRNIEYNVWAGDEDIIYSISETDESDKFERVGLAHEQDTLLISPVIHEEKIPDETEHFYDSMKFEKIFDGSNMEFYTALIEAREAEATLSILALVRSLQNGSLIPNILYNIPELKTRK